VPTVRAPTPVQPILRLAPVEAYYVTHFTTFDGAAGKFVVKPLYNTKASVYEGISMITLSSMADDVDCETENFKESEL
jgi:hypothetical protein